MIHTNEEGTILSLRKNRPLLKVDGCAEDLLRLGRLRALGRPLLLGSRLLPRLRSFLLRSVQLELRFRLGHVNPPCMPVGRA